MNTSQLEYIVALAKSRHFARAAKKCFVTQPTLSVQIQKLEQQLGVDLFDRTRQPIRPTLVGERVIAQAKSVLRELQQLQDVASQSKGVVEGRYSLGIIPTVASDLIPLMTDAFERRYPAVTLLIEEVTTSNMIRLLENDQLDGGLAATPLGHDQLNEDVLYYEDFFVYACENIGKKPGSTVSSKDIDISRLLLMKDGHCFRNQVLKLCRQTNDSDTGVHYEGGSFDTLIKLVDKGCGMTLIPQLTTLTLDPKKYRERVFSFEAPVPQREISLVTKHTLAKKAIHDALRDVIRDVLPENIAREKSAGSKILDPL